MYIGNIAQVKPEALDYINEDAMVIEYAERLGCLNKINPSEEVEQIRQARAQQQQVAEDLESRAQEAKIAKDEAKAQQTNQQVVQNTNQVSGPLLPLDNMMSGGATNA